MGQQEVYEFIKRHPGLTLKQIGIELAGFIANKGSVYNSVGIMVRHGEIDRVYDIMTNKSIYFVRGEHRQTPITRGLNKSLEEVTKVVKRIRIDKPLLINKSEEILRRKREAVKLIELLDEHRSNAEKLHEQCLNLLNLDLKELVKERAEIIKKMENL